MAFDESARELALVDPAGGGTWTWDGVHAWRQRQSAAPMATLRVKVGGPPFGLGWDSPSSSLIAVIGDFPPAIGTPQARPSTWLWHSGAWTPLARASTPDAAGGAIAAFPPKQQLIMFSGCCTLSSRSWAAKPGMWAWDGSVWTELHPTHMPPARWGQAIVYDPTIGRTVMYGGASIEPDHPALGDMWAWDGTDWSPLLAPPIPVDLYPATALAYASDGALILTTTDVSRSQSNATWTWRGSSWTRLDVATPDCVWCELAYDPVRKLTVMVTNADGNPMGLNQVWVWNGARWSQRS